MLREGRHADKDTDDHAPQAADVDPNRDPTTFSHAGPVPPVAKDGDPNAVPPTASERAYGHSTFPGLGYMGGIGLGTTPPIGPTINKGTLNVAAARSDAEQLLTAKGMDASASAKQALELLVDLPDGDRGSVIDSLSPKAFDNLIDRISESDRERYYRLVEVSKNPERKLRLWAEAHKSKATNNVERYKGDIGGAIPKTKEEDDDTGAVTEVVDDEAEAEIEKKLPKDKLRNRKRHFRREKAAASTLDEVDAEVAALKQEAKDNKAQISLKDVDDLIERKELEYKIELESNVNLTSEPANAKHDNAFWKKEDLVEVERTLPRLPQANNPDGFERLNRVHSEGGWGVGGVTHDHDPTGHSIDITDWASGPSPGFRHGGDKRELVSDDYKKQNGDTIGTMEFVLTHEIGHDYDFTHAKQYEAFKKAAGWEKVKVDALVADGVSADKIAELESRRSDPNSKTSDIKGRTKIYSPDAGSKDEYWAVPITAIPAQNEAAPGSQNTDTWSYSRVNPDEHFAETYAKAVHVPEKLHDELIVRPEAAAAEARDKYLSMHHALARAEADTSKNGQFKAANLRALTNALKADMLRLEQARDERKAEYEVMRNDVFHTEEAVKLSVARLEFRGIHKDKIDTFKERAAAAATPEQVAFLENEALK